MAGEFLRVQEITPRETVEVNGLKLTPVEVDHVVPTCGYIVEDESSCVVISSDTAPTQEIWSLANEREKVDAVFLEASFPESYAELAGISKHLTPRLFAAELQKLRHRPVPVAVHIKAFLLEEIVGELKSLGIENLEIGDAAKEYEFP